jgi:hypothetical protein
VRGNYQFEDVEFNGLTNPMIPIWLVWTLHTNGSRVLQVVTTSQRKAAAYRRDMFDNPDSPESKDVVHCLIESNYTNHLFGESLANNRRRKA